MHATGKLNIVDMGTREGVRLEEVGPKSLWQTSAQAGGEKTHTEQKVLGKLK